MKLNLSIKSANLDRFLLKIKLKECEERLVRINKPKIKGLVFGNPSKKDKNWFLRESVAKTLFRVAKDFWKQGYVLEIKDAYRSIKVQKQIFLEYLTKIKKEYPKINLLKAQQKANTFVAGIPLLAAHTAGAAVDAILLSKNGTIIDMGCDYLTFNQSTITDNSLISKEQKANRLILKSIFSKHGFTNYPYEYWHYSIGDVCAAYLNKQKYAIYGPLELITNSKRQEVIFLKSKDQIYNFFK